MLFYKDLSSIQEITPFEIFSWRKLLQFKLKKGGRLQGLKNFNFTAESIEIFLIQKQPTPLSEATTHTYTYR